MPTYYDDDEAKMEQGSTTFISSSYSDNLISNASAPTSSQFLNDKPEREDRSKPEGSSSLRGINTPYKEKFLALRQKYESVNSAHDDYLRDLELAQARMKKLQAENDLLLDAVGLLMAIEQNPQPLPTLLAPLPLPPSHPPSNSQTYPQSQGQGLAQPPLPPPPPQLLPQAPYHHQQQQQQQYHDGLTHHHHIPPPAPPPAPPQYAPYPPPPLPPQSQSQPQPHPRTHHSPPQPPPPQTQTPTPTPSHPQPHPQTQTRTYPQNTTSSSTNNNIIIINGHTPTLGRHIAPAPVPPAPPPGSQQASVNGVSHHTREVRPRRASSTREGVNGHRRS